MKWKFNKYLSELRPNNGGDKKASYGRVFGIETREELLEHVHVEISTVVDEVKQHFELALLVGRVEPMHEFQKD